LGTTSAGRSLPVSNTASRVNIPESHSSRGHTSGSAQVAPMTTMRLDVNGEVETL
jgi:hypothetical protein